MYALNLSFISSISSLQLNNILFTITSAGLYFDISSKSIAKLFVSSIFVDKNVPIVTSQTAIPKYIPFLYIDII